MNKRTFLKQGIAAAALSGVARAEKTTSETSDWPIILFEKPVQALSYDEIADRLAGMGIQGIEATIRTDGHIKPENAAKEVPGLVKSMAKAGLSTIIPATHLNLPDEHTREQLKIFRDNGITQYRMQHYRYSKTGDPLAEARSHRETLLKLAEMNAEIGIHGVYQIHSGWHIAGALIWDAALMFEGIDPDHIGLAYDLRHSKTDTGLSWKLAAQLAQKHTRALYIKDAKWGGERSDKLVNVPLDTGFVNQKIFDHVRSGLSPMPISLHMEWGEHQVYPSDKAQEAWKLIERDIAVLKKWRDA